MTPAASILEPNSNPALYVSAVLTLYADLPDTPLRASVPDQRQARSWFDRGVPLEVVETAKQRSNRAFERARNGPRILMRDLLEDAPAYARAREAGKAPWPG